MPAHNTRPRRLSWLLLIASLICWGASSCGTPASVGPVSGEAWSFMCRPVYSPAQRAIAPDGMTGRHVTVGDNLLRNDGSGTAQMLTAQLAPGSKGLQLGPVLLGPISTTGKSALVGIWIGAFPPTVYPMWSKNGYDWKQLKPLGQSRIPGHTRMNLVYELTLPPGATLGDSKGLVITYKIGHHRYRMVTPGEIQIPQYPAKCTSERSPHS